MVVTLVWIHSWAVMAISGAVLLVLGLFLIFCLCWHGKQSIPQPHKFFMVDENGMKTTSILSHSLQNENSGIFRKFSNTDLWKINFKFPGSNSKTLTIYDKANLINNTKELMDDSLDIDKQFNSAVLEIDKAVENEDAKSCGSNDSRYTYYSVYPIMRADSMAETMRSASSHPENLDKY